MFEEITVNKPYSPIKNKGEGVLFDIDNSGARLFILFNKPSGDEIKQTESNNRRGSC